MPQDETNPAKKNWVAKQMPANRRRMLENEVNPESIDDVTFATFLLEQEIQPTVNDDPKRTVRVRNV
jgi:hypothetical protein